VCSSDLRMSASLRLCVKIPSFALLFHVSRSEWRLK
jgi:hypothetical protein